MRRTFRTLDFDPDPARDMEEEFRAHLEMTVEELVARGLSREAAEAEARRRFGDLRTIRKEATGPAEARVRREKAVAWIGSVLEDLRYGLRGYRKAPGFTSVVVLTLALGMGAMSSIFSLVNGYFLKPLPYPDPGALTLIWEVKPEDGSDMTVTPADFRDWQRESTSFSRMAGFNVSTANLSGDGMEARRAIGSVVTEGFFRTLGVGPVMGPGFSPEHFVHGGPPAAILSHGLWQSRYGGDPQIIGKTVRIDGEAVPVVGVMGPRYQHPDPSPEWLDVEVIQPLTVSPGEMLRRRSRWMRVMARLAPGVTLDEAQAEMDRIALDVARANPETNQGWGARVVTLRDAQFGAARPALLTLLAAGALVLLIVCVNLANLFLARSGRRQREFAIRSAIGCGRRRITRQVILEGTLISLVAGGIGLILTLGISGILVAVKDRYFPSMADVGMDFRVVGFTLATAMLVAVLFSILPALAASRPGIKSTLTQGTPGAGTTARARRSRETLVVLEISLTAALLFGAILLARSFLTLVSVPTGFNHGDVAVMEIRIPRNRTSSPEEVYGLWEHLQERVAAIPGARSVTFSSDPPFTPWNSYKRLRVEGDTRPEEELPVIEYSPVGPGFFRVLGIPLLAGRGFDRGDRDGSGPVAVVSESLAQRLWPGQSALGRRFEMSVRRKPDPVSFQVVGIAGDIREDGFDRPTEPMIYIPFFQEPQSLGSILVETGGQPLGMAPELRKALRETDRELTLSFISTINGLMGDSVAVPRAALLVSSAFGLLTLVLAAVGVFGVMASAVSERRREIGVRASLGATGRAIASMVLRRSLYLTFAGILLGLLGAAFLGKVLESLLFQVSARDPAAFVLTALVLSLVSGLSAWVPARQASRVDPMITLRAD
jgi:predicted permease